MGRGHVWACSLLVMLCAGYAGGQPDEEIDVEALLAYVRQAKRGRQSLLRNVKLDIRMVYGRPTEEGGFRRRGERRTELITKEDRERTRGWQRRGEEEQMQWSGANIRNGEVVLDYHPTHGADPDAKVGRAARGRLTAGKGRQLTITGPLFGGGYLYELSDVLNSSNLEVASEAEEINGLRCVKLSASLPNGDDEMLEMSYWICPARDALPVRMEMRLEDGSLHKSWELMQFQKLNDGRWFPAKVKANEWRREGPGQVRKLNRVSWEVAGVELDPNVTDEMFRTSPDVVPEGYLFQDGLTGTEYIIGEGPISDERVRRVIDDTIGRFGEELGELGEAAGEAEEPAAEPEPRAIYDEEGIAASDPVPPPDRSRGWMQVSLAAVAVVLAAVGGYILHRRWWRPARFKR